MRVAYESDLAGFRTDDRVDILKTLVDGSGTGTTPEQKNAWSAEIDLLHQELSGLPSGHLFLEFEIPRLGRRVDAILIFSGIIFVIEFKIGSKKYISTYVEQCVDYALDLKNFHEGSRDASIIPILVATKAQEQHVSFNMDRDRVFQPVMHNGDGLGKTIMEVASKHPGSSIDADLWVKSSYKPTPTIIEAARDLYVRHGVLNIIINDAGDSNLQRTIAAIDNIVQKSKTQKRRSICFVTGVPGAGKTLAGLNLVSRYQNPDGHRNAVFLSGNGPLVEVLHEALARDAYDQAKQKELTEPGRKKITKKMFRDRFSVLIQALHHFLSNMVDNTNPTFEKIAIFDEAQRAWDVTATNKFLKKKNLEQQDKSQPELLIDIMGRHDDCVVVCLVGGGQEINHNEAGLPEWLRAVHRSDTAWDVYMSNELTDREHMQGNNVEDLLGHITPHFVSELHLNTSIRSFRSKNTSKFVKALLDIDPDGAKELLQNSLQKYPIVLTRDFGCAKRWLHEMARGSERFGVVAAAKSYRLKPHGIYVELAASAVHWFLNNRDDPRSSYSLEYAATEFKVQGLELDWTCVAWDADLRYVDGRWFHREFSGDRWKIIHKEDKKRYLENAYRVLLTRARQGMVIFVPKGDPHDATRKDDFYDGVYCYLKKIGIQELTP